MGCCGLENSGKVTVTYVHLREYEPTVVTEEPHVKPWAVFVIIFISFRISLNWIN
jgi:hypothetical protein